jgi:hypothetical protein
MTVGTGRIWMMLHDVHTPGGVGLVYIRAPQKVSNLVGRLATISFSRRALFRELTSSVDQDVNAAPLTA